MAHNTKEMLRLIKANPGIRQVEIADKVDCEIEAVEWALKVQIEMGDVVRSQVTGPNGVTQSAYKLAANFEVLEDAAPIMSVAPKPAPESKAAPAPLQTKPSKSKPELAIDYLAKVGFADDVALRVVMGLHIGGNVKAYLATALDKRKVIRAKINGVMGYAIGDGTPTKVAEKQPVIQEHKTMSIPVFAASTPAITTPAQSIAVEPNHSPAPIVATPNKYQRQVKGATVDVYDILKAWDVRNPAVQHAIKKLLQPGQRGHKDMLQDLREAGQSVARALELESVPQDGNG